MNITVIGHLCLDVIHYGDEKETKSYGGIFFAVAALANLLDRHATILPVFGVGQQEYAEFMERLSDYPNIEPSGIYKFKQQTNEVHLYYHNEQQRTECSKFIAEPIPFKHIKSYLDTDIVLVNMVSGFDITLETLDQIRMAVRDRHVPVYFDVHSLSLGIREDHTRFRRPVMDWRRWLFWLHAVQMNEEEASGLTEEKFIEDDFAKHVTALNTPALLITRGHNGCTAYTDERKKLTRHDVAGIPITRSVDATGCGDVFGAAYCAKYLTTRNILQSVEFANTVAAFNATIAGSTEIDRLAQFNITNPPVESLPVSPGAAS